MYSPPVVKPWTARNTNSRIGAHTPITANVGRMPMQKVAALMISTQRPSILFRPIRSPYLPKKAAPSGLAMKPPAKIAHTASRDAVVE